MKLAAYDRELRRSRGIERIGGLDEAGRGALAGPVVAAAVVLGPEAKLPGVNDSKALRPERREALVPEILAQARSVGLGLATAREVDTLNVLQATHRAAARSLTLLDPPPELLVTDYLKLTGAPAPILAIAKGDGTSLAVAAASILAKVARDRIMMLLDAEYPDYGFARHKGYGTAAHLSALQARGASTVHRLSFAGVCWFGQSATVRARSAGGQGLGGIRPDIELLDLLRDKSAAASARPFLPEAEFISDAPVISHFSG